jgi:hypothetical protein
MFQDAGDIPKDVATVLQDKCWGCHGNPTHAHAPFSFITYEEMIQPNPLQSGKLIVQTMALVILPDGQRPANLPHMPFQPAPPLTAAEFTTLSGWLDSCAVPVPEGSGGDVDGG